MMWGYDESLESIFERIWAMNLRFRPNLGEKFRLPVTKVYGGEELPWSTAVGRPPWFVQTILTLWGIELLIPLLKHKGMTIYHTDEFVQSQFSDGVLIVRYINKMGTNGGGGVVDGVALRRLQAILVPG